MLLLKIPQKVKTRWMRYEYPSVTSSLDWKHSVRPHPLTQHLSLLRTCVALSCLFYLIITLRETFEVTHWHSEFHCLSIMVPGFHSTFLTGGGQLLLPLWEGGYPTGADAYRNVRPAFHLSVEVRFVYPPSDSTASYQREMATILKKKRRPLFKVRGNSSTSECWSFPWRKMLMSFSANVFSTCTHVRL